MSTISAPSTVRQWKKIPGINNAANDYTNESGVRVSIPVYIDLTSSQRKQILNAIREVAAVRTSAVNSHTGLTVETSTDSQGDVEAYLGISIDVLRSVLFGRGGLEAGLLLRLQEVSGLEFITQKEFAAAFKARLEVVKNYTSLYPFQESDSEA